MFVDEVVGTALDDELLHARTGRVQRVKSYNCSVDVGETVEQFVGSGKFLSFAVGELLEKRGELPL